MAVVHPQASGAEVNTFLECMGWESEADNPLWVVHEQLGTHQGVNCLVSVLISRTPDQSLPSTLPLSHRLSPTLMAPSSPPPNSATQLPITLRQLLAHHLDINAVPRRGFFRLLRHFTADEREIERLDELGEGTELSAVSSTSFFLVFLIHLLTLFMRVARHIVE